MKNGLLILLLCLTKICFSQEPEQYYQTSNGEYAFKMDEEFCVLYQISHYNNTAYQEWELGRVEKFGKELDSLGILFSNGQYAVSYDYKYFRVCDLKNGKIKDRRTYVAKKVNDPSKIYEAVNHSYWDAIYRKTIEDTRSDYPLFGEYYYRYRNGYGLWDSLSFKQADPRTFESLANERNKELKDSLSKTNSRLISLNDSINRQINTLTLEDLKRNLLSRPLHNSAYREYQSELLDLVAVKRPDLYFDLVEALPDEKEYLFNQVYMRDAVKSLKRYDTDAPVKKEFLRYKRKEDFKTVMLMTGGGLLEVGVIGGAITGIVFWIRK